MLPAFVFSHHSDASARFWYILYMYHRIIFIVFLSRFSRKTFIYYSFLAPSSHLLFDFGTLQNKTLNFFHRSLEKCPFAGFKLSIIFAFANGSFRQRLGNGNQKLFYLPESIMTFSVLLEKNLD